MTATPAAAVDIADRPDPALEIRPSNVPAPYQPGATPSGLTHISNTLTLLRPVAPIADVIIQQNEMREFIQKALVEDRDYGKIPGIDKPSLLKPGAERINSAYGVIARFTIVEREIDHDRENNWRKERRVYANGTWTGEVNVIEGLSYGLYRIVMQCDLVHRASGVVVASCIGSCSTLESKYIDRPRDSENTIYKMAEKRAYVGATLLAYGLSDQFTQDVEDTGGTSDTPDAPAKAGQQPAKIALPMCDVHNVPMRDQRQTKRNVKAPDYKCTRYDMRDGVKVWCDRVMWPGEWPPKNPQAPTGESSSTPSFVGEGASPSASGNGETTSDSGSSAANTAAPNGTISTAENPTAVIERSGTTADSSRTSATRATVSGITRETPIDWVPLPAGERVNGRCVKDLTAQELAYFYDRIDGVPRGWHSVIDAEIAQRESEAMATA